MKKVRMNQNGKASYIVNEVTGKVKIRMADFYPGYSGDEEYKEVDRKHFDLLVSEIRKENRNLRQEWLHVSKYPFDEIIMGEMDDIYEKGADDVFFTDLKNKALYDAIKQLVPSLQRRLYMHYFQGKSNNEIAEIEGVTPSAITQSINVAIEKLSLLIKIKDVV